MATFLQFEDLKRRRIVNNRPTLQNWIRKEGFPPGVLIGPNSRAWEESAVEAWLASRSTAPKAAPKKIVAIEAISTEPKPDKSCRPEVASIPATSLTQSEAARLAGIGRSSIQRARIVARRGAAELNDAVKAGTITVSAAAKAIALLPDHSDQVAALDAAKDTPRQLVAIARQLAMLN